LQEVAPGKDAFVLRFEFGGHVIARLSQRWIVFSK
jgi:hypothetical protein